MTMVISVIEFGSVVDLNQYNPTVKYAGLDPETGEKITGTLDNKNVRWRVEYDSEKWERTPATAEQDIPALVRISGTGDSDRTGSTGTP